MTQPLAILIVGDIGRAEFRDARRELDRWGAVTAAGSIAEAAVLLDDSSYSPAVIVIAQAYPGEFPAETVERLRRRAPLARLVALLGPWCEGETRSGRPWPGGIRVYWHQWPARAACELARIAGGLFSSWSLPATASEEERYLALSGKPNSICDGLVAVISPHPAMQAWIAAACRRQGFATAEVRPQSEAPVGGVAAAIFDGSEARGVELAELRRWVAAVAPAPLIALLDFPRVEDRDRALEAGAAAVLSKPLVLEDLYWQIEHSLT